MKGRMYDPKVGRFLTMDPLVSHPSFSQSWNPYSYVLNNPLKYVDPSGFDGVPQGGPPPGAVDERNNPHVQEYFNNPEVRAIIDSGCIGDECNHKLVPPVRSLIIFRRSPGGARAAAKRTRGLGRSPN